MIRIMTQIYAYHYSRTVWLTSCGTCIYIHTPLVWKGKDWWANGFRNLPWYECDNEIDVIHSFAAFFEDLNTLSTMYKHVNALEFHLLNNRPDTYSTQTSSTFVYLWNDFMLCRICGDTIRKWASTTHVNDTVGGLRRVFSYKWVFEKSTYKYPKLE